MHNIPDLHCPPFSHPSRKPSMAGSATATETGTLASSGHMILEDVKGWLGSSVETQIVGRWVPDGFALGELGATMTVAFSEPLTADELGDDKDQKSITSYAAECAADEFFWLDCIHRDGTQEALVAMLPWSCSAQYRHPIVGRGDVQTLRSNTGAPWKTGGELHVTFDESGHPFCAELQIAFWLKAEVADGIQELSDQLSRKASRTDNPIYETVTDGDEVRFEESWWSNDTVHYEVFCTLGDEGPAGADPDAAPHYITVRKFLHPPKQIQ